MPTILVGTEDGIHTAGDGQAPAPEVHKGLTPPRDGR